MKYGDCLHPLYGADQAGRILERDRGDPPPPAGGQAGKREGEGLLEEWGAQKEEKNTRLCSTHACNLHSNHSMPA